MTIRQKARRFIAAVLTLALLLLLSGCFDRRELDTLAIVVGVGLDKGEEENSVRVTLQMANIGASEQTDPKSASKGVSSFINESEEGPAVNYAIRNMQSKVSRKLYLAHNKVIVIGEEIAEKGMSDMLDFFVRAPEARLTVNLFIAEGEAGEILGTSTNFEQLPSSELQELVRDQKVTSTAPVVTELDFVSSLIGKATEAYAPLVRIIEEKGDKQLQISGTAVFKDAKMVGKLNEFETQGMLHVQDRYKQGVLFAVIEDTPATIEIMDSKTKFEPEVFEDGSVAMHLKLNVDVGLGDQGQGINLFTPPNMDKVRSAVADVIRQQITSAIEKAKEYNADIFGFGQSLSRSYPKQWKDMEEQWNTIFRDVKYDVEVSVVPKQSGRTTTFIKPQ